MKNLVKSTFAVVMLVAAHSAAYAGCCSTVVSNAHSPANGFCSSSRIKTTWTPTTNDTCGFTLNPFAGCTPGTTPLKRRDTGWTGPGCTGTMVYDSGWVASGNTGNATAYVCF